MLGRVIMWSHHNYYTMECDYIAVTYIHIIQFSESMATTYDDSVYVTIYAVYIICRRH